MKHTICGFQQKKLVELELDSHDAIMLRWFVDFKDAGEMETIQYNGYTWYWILYQYVIDELPIIGITNRESLSRRLGKLVKANILDRHIVKQKGTYTYYRIVPETYIDLIRHPTEKSGNKHSTQKSGDNETPDLKIDPNDKTFKSGGTRPKSRPKDSSAINPFLTLTVEAEKNINFIHAFNDFCVSDDELYRKDKAYWIFHNAEKYKCSLGDIIDALNTCCEKGKEGSLSYLTGILRKKNEARGNGIKAYGKPIMIQVEEYLKNRLSGHMELLSGYDFDFQDGTVRYTMRNINDAEAMQEILDNIIAIDVKNHTGVDILFQAR